LNVHDNADFDANVNIDGNTQNTGDLNVDGVTTVDSLNVHENADFDQDVNIDGNLQVDLNLDVDGATDLDSTLDVQGATNLQSTLTVAGNATFNDYVDMNDTLDVAMAGLFRTPVATGTGVDAEGELVVYNEWGAAIFEVDGHNDITVIQNLLVQNDFDYNGDLEVSGDLSAGFGNFSMYVESGANTLNTMIPLQNNHLTRKDYVDGLVADSMGVAMDSIAAHRTELDALAGGNEDLQDAIDSLALVTDTLRLDVDSLFTLSAIGADSLAAHRTDIDSLFTFTDLFVQAFMSLDSIFDFDENGSGNAISHTVDSLFTLSAIGADSLAAHRTDLDSLFTLAGMAIDTAGVFRDSLDSYHARLEVLEGRPEAWSYDASLINIATGAGVNSSVYYLNGNLVLYADSTATDSKNYTITIIGENLNGSDIKLYAENNSYDVDGDLDADWTATSSQASFKIGYDDIDGLVACTEGVVRATLVIDGKMTGLHLFFDLVNP
jgi:hypothetical protein